MQTLYATCLLLLSVVFLPVSGVRADPVHDVLFTQLQDENMGVRIAALRALQLTLDPRLPEALFQLLDDEGNSIRRLAARGIGSRYWQIPEERFPAFLEALEINLQSEFHDEAAMAKRAIALLTKTYDGPEMSRSANGRWVLYERYSLPCLIDTQSGTEELLGWQTEEYAHFYYHGQDDAEADFTCWHPEKELVVLNVSLSRRVSTLWAWTHRAGVKQLDHSKVFEALGVDEEFVSGPGGFYVEHTGWSGDAIRFTCDFVDLGSPNNPNPEVSADLLWNPETGEVSKVISNPQ